MTAGAGAGGAAAPVVHDDLLDPGHPPPALTGHLAGLLDALVGRWH